jgi:long-chain acyl-CoA synthetase
MNGPGDILPRAAARYGPKSALVTGGRTFTYTELNALSDRVAQGLAARGVAVGDRVSLLSQNRWEWIVAYHGILKAGAVVNPLNVMLTGEEIAYVIGDCGASAIMVSGDRAPDLVGLADEAPTLHTVVCFDEPAPGTLGFDELLTTAGEPPLAWTPDPSALSTIGYTSGTTGRPKGAMQSHRAVLLNCALTATMHVRTSQDVVLSPLPAPHVYGNVVINGTFMAGGTVVLMERFDAAAALSLIHEHGATLFEGVPTMYAMMLAHPDIERTDLSSITRSTVGGQTIGVSVIEEWEGRSGAPLLELWGMTELSGLGTTHALYAPNVHGSIGVALPGIELRTDSLDNPGETTPIGEPGELMVRGPIVTLGYWGDEEATRAVLDADGWLTTGDVAYVDEDGHYFIVDRLKDMIITGGYNVYPAEIERVVSEHPAVAMVAVGRIADDIKGELARAYVVLRPGLAATEVDIVGHCRERLAPYKIPRSVAFVDDLPKTSSGKLMRRELFRLDEPTAAPGTR